MSWIFGNVGDGEWGGGRSARPTMPVTPPNSNEVASNQCAWMDPFDGWYWRKWNCVPERIQSAIGTFRLLEIQTNRNAQFNGYKPMNQCHNAEWRERDSTIGSRAQRTMSKLSITYSLFGWPHRFNCTRTPATNGNSNASVSVGLWKTFKYSIGTSYRYDLHGTDSHPNSEPLSGLKTLFVCVLTSNKDIHFRSKRSQYVRFCEWVRVWIVTCGNIVASPCINLTDKESA